MNYTRAATNLIVVILLTAFGALPVDAQSLRDEAVAAVRAAAPDAVVTPLDPLAFKVERAPKQEFQINLDRIQRFCATNAAEECAAEKKRFIAGIVEMLTADDTITPSRLRVAIRDNAYVQQLALLGEGKGLADPPITLPFADGVSLIVVADFPTTTRMVGAAAVKEIGLNRDEAMALATRQVLASLPKVPTAEEVDGKVLSLAGLDYGASILLQPERWQALAIATGGRLFVAVPADNDVLIGTVKSGVDLRRLEKVVAESYAGASRGISPHVFRWSPSGWEVAK